jgi:hypothetical protein
MKSRMLFAPAGEVAGGGGEAAPVVQTVATAAPVVPAATAAPAATVPVVVPAAAAVAAPVAAVPDAADPNWLRPRLAREVETARRALLAELGVTDPAAAKAAIADANAAAEAKKSAEQRALEASQRLTAEQGETARLRAITQEHAARMIGVLTPAQQAAVRELSPDTDPAGQLRAIGVLGPTWAAAAAASVAPAAATTTVPAPATTAPAATAPAGGVSTSEPDHKAVYRTTRTTNPFAAAAYGLENADKVYATKR